MPDGVKPRFVPGADWPETRDRRVEQSEPSMPITGEVGVILINLGVNRLSCRVIGLPSWYLGISTSG